jgi:hypothetical protein
MTMKKTLYKFLISGFAVAFILGSCTKDFEEINTNPNEPGLDQAPASMLLTNAIESMTDRVHEIFLGHEMGECWVQHLAKVQYTDEDRYIPRASVINNSWNGFYATNAMDVYSVIKIARSTGNDSYLGVGLVLKAYISSVLTDLFGDIPYSEAWRGAVEEGGIMQPKYDTQESVYTDLLAILDTANMLLSEDGPEIQGDILFDGDLMAWKKFANSLRMRLLLRISDRNPSLVTTELTAMVSDPATYPIFESSADNAALHYLGSAPNNNPVNENRKTRDDHRVSKTLIDLLWAKTNYVDWRVCIYAELDGNGDFEGLPNGLASSKAALYNGNGLKYTSKLGAYFTAATAPGVLMTYAETQFILAEAAHKGYISGGDAAAEAYYLGGIYGSYEQFGQPLLDLEEEYFGMGITDIDTLANDFYVNDVWQWDPTRAMECIGTQKWVALFSQGLEAWFEWRRIGYPVLVAAEDGVLDGKIPVRVTYPSDEDARNKANKDAAIANQGGVDLLTNPVWWDVN